MARYGVAYMLSHKPREIHRLLNESGPLASPSGRERVSRIRVIVAALDDVAKAMNIASLKLHSAGFHTVALSVPDGGSATRLRYQNRDLLAKLKQYSGLDIVRVAIRVDPQSHHALPLTLAANVKSRRAIHPAVAAHLEAAAAGVDDPGLRAALRRLAGRVPKNQ